jgi:hypothetical protein
MREIGAGWLIVLLLCGGAAAVIVASGLAVSQGCGHQGDPPALFNVLLYPGICAIAAGVFLWIWPRWVLGVVAAAVAGAVVFVGAGLVILGEWVSNCAN